MDVLRIRLKKGFSSDFAWEKLAEDGQNVLFSSEEGDVCDLILQPSLFLKEYDFIDSIEKIILQDTDWNLQWQQHALDFRDGMMHLDLQPFGHSATLLLKPGPGFGDMSHATTSLVLSMMPQYVLNRTVVDIGSGSGILSIAAALFGAKKVIGIEIDPEAIEHAMDNAKLNQVQAAFLLPSQTIAFDLNESYLILMNMIVKEQQMAWKMTQFPRSAHGMAIVSGILVQELENYLNIAKKWGWSLEEKNEKEGWLGLRFTF